MQGMQELFPGIFAKGKKLFTKNLVRGFRVHGERLLEEKNVEYREWNPNQSKLAAAIARGLKAMPIKPGSVVLYLGAAQGATPSFVSDVVGERGGVYCVEVSPRAMRDLIRVCEKRENMLPLLADARKPEDYAREVEGGRVDVVFEDVADPQQALIAKQNARFLRKGAHCLLAVKARCVSSVAEPEKVYARVKKELSEVYRVVEELRLDPFEEDHAFLSLEKR